MKGEVITELGVTPSGKYWLATFVVELDSHKQANELKPQIEQLVAEFVRDKVRHGIHIVPSPDTIAEGPITQD